MLEKGIIIFANSRAELLSDCIKSVLSARGSEYWKKILIYQKGISEVEKIVDKNSNQFDILIKINKQFENSLSNINYNRVFGTSLCFDRLKLQYVLGIEEDSSISYDALSFIDEIYKRYSGRRAFRGINLGSHQPFVKEKLNTYSLLRFGLHGQGGVLTRKTWNKISSNKLLLDISKEGWDSKIEYHLKTGFMVTPNLSRIIDRGWNGTHAPTDPMAPYFERMRKSWVGNFYASPNYLKNINEKHLWRKDAIIYKKWQSLFYYMRLNSILYYLYRKTLKKVDVIRAFTSNGK